MPKKNLGGTGAEPPRGGAADQFPGGGRFQREMSLNAGPREGARKPRWAEPPWGQASGSAGLGGRLPRLGRRPHGRGPGRPEVQRPRSQTLARSAAYAAFGQAVSRTRSAARAGRVPAGARAAPGARRTPLRSGAAGGRARRAAAGASTLRAALRTDSARGQVDHYLLI